MSSLRAGLAVAVVSLAAAAASAGPRDTTVRVSVRAPQDETSLESLGHVQDALRKPKPAAVLRLVEASESPEMVLSLRSRFLAVGSESAGFRLRADVTRGRDPYPVTLGVVPSTSWRNAAGQLVDELVAFANAELHRILRERPDWPAVGFEFEKLTSEGQQALGHKDGAVVITSLQADGIALRAGLHPGDAVLRAGGEKLKGPAALARALYTAEPGASLALEVAARGGGARRTVTLALP